MVKDLAMVAGSKKRERGMGWGQKYTLQNRASVTSLLQPAHSA
jgi:hypothetical protein